MALRLHGAPDHAQTGMKDIAFQHRGRHHRVVRPLARTGTVDVAGLREPEAPVLQHEATSRCGNAGAEALEDAAHQGHGQAAGVHHHGADRVAGGVGHGFLRVAHGVAHVLDHADCGGRIGRVQRQRVQRLQRVQHGDAVGVGRAFQHRPAAKARARGWGEVAAVAGEVFRHQRAPEPLHGALRRHGGGTEVEGIRALVGDRLQHRGQFRVQESVPRAGQRVGAVEARADRVRAEHRLEQRPFAGRDRRDGKAPGGGLDRVLEQLRPGQAAKAAVQVVPAAHHAGHRDRERMPLGNAPPGQALQGVQRQAGPMYSALI
eukprot:Opistho-1_new@53360